MIPYIPRTFDSPRIIDVTSAWSNIPTVIKDILDRFNIARNVALEFGVERGYSTSALANYFARVIGVDPFDWVLPDGMPRDYYSVLNILRNYTNIQLIKAMSDEFMRYKIFERYDLIHIDIGYDTHAYSTTFPSAEWAVQHSDCVLFHDTMSFPEITQVCDELSEKYGFDFYNYSEEIGPAGIICGLGILIKKQ